MKISVFFLGLFLLFPCVVFSQELPDDVVVIPAPNHEKLKKNQDNYFFEQIPTIGVSYTPSENFVNTNNNRFCLPTRKLFGCLGSSICCWGCSYPFLVSADDEVMIFAKTHTASEKEHINTILKESLKYLGKSDENWENFVSFYSKKKAKKRFNNEQVFRYTIPLSSEDFMKENGKEYKYVEKFFIWNKEVGFVDLTCFYTDTAKDNFPKYWSEIEKMFEYQKK